MLLGNLLKSINKNYRKIFVKGISFDSRDVKKNDTFFAIKGNKISGIIYGGDVTTIRYTNMCNSFKRCSDGYVISN